MIGLSLRILGIQRVLARLQATGKNIENAKEALQKGIGTVKPGFDITDKRGSKSPGLGATLTGFVTSERVKVAMFEKMRQARQLVAIINVGDERVCAICKAAEGTTFEIDEVEDVLPLHPNCRCGYIPVATPTGRFKKAEAEALKRRKMGRTAVGRFRKRLAGGVQILRRRRRKKA